MPKKVSVLILSVLFFSVFYLFSGFFTPPLNKHADTHLASGFTWERFEQVKIGMHKTEVDELIGTSPFRTRVLEPSKTVCYQYTKGGKLSPFRFADSEVEVCFNDNIVVDVHQF